jgi:sugar lactone lactonase YvrE
VTGGRFVKTAFFLATLFLAANAWAAGSSLWESEFRADFEAGEPDGVSVTPAGAVVLGPESVETILDGSLAWSLAEDSKGNIYVGTGSEGKIFRVSPGGEAELFAELELQQVFAIAVGKKDVIYAAGFPGGKIFAVDADGAITEYFDTGADSIWSLCVAGDGTLTAGTGDEGGIYKVTASGEGGIVYDSPQRRILSLLCDESGMIYAGTEQSGIIYRIDADGRPFVFYDTELEEITAMTMDDEGNLYAASSPGGLFVRIPIKSVVAGVAPAGNGGNPHAGQSGAAPVGAGMPAIPSGKKRACLLYKISPEGVGSVLWKSPDKLIFSLAFDGVNILAGSGDDGIIYLITPDGENSQYYKVGQKQVLDMIPSRDSSGEGRIIASSGNEAAVVILGGGHTEQGTIISRTHDATAVSGWGRVYWEADTPRRTGVSISTRSGNSEQPDDTWSEWSREHDDEEGFVSESPVARFIQWRARLKGSGNAESPTLKKVTIAYLQKNLAPIIESVSVEGNGGGKGAAAGKQAKKSPAGAGAKGGNGASKDGVKKAPTSHSSKLMIKWKASDGNDDALEFDVFFKGAEEKMWKPLKDELSKKQYEWDTEAVPDGSYHVKVKASDSPDNPEEYALASEKASEPFIIDNTSPTVTSLRVVREKGGVDYRVTGEVADNLGPVRSAQYSVDAGGWAAVFPADGIFDSASEKMEFAISSPGPGEHTLVIKAVDYYGNVGAGKIVFETK